MSLFRYFQVVANAWLETLLDAIDLLPPDVIKREIVVIAVNKAQIEQSVTSKKAACRSIIYSNKQWGSECQICKIWQYLNTSFSA